MKTALVKGVTMLGLVGALTSTGDAQAATCTAVGCESTITELYVRSGTGYTHIRLDGDLSPSGCTLQGGKYWLLDKSEEAIYKTLLAAFLAGKSVYLRENETSGNCVIGYVIMSN